MGRTTFSGPVKSPGGFEVGTGRSKGGTDIPIISGSAVTTSLKKTIIAATGSVNLTAAQSCGVVNITAAANPTVVLLPDAAAGLEYRVAITATGVTANVIHVRPQAADTLIVYAGATAGAAINTATTVGQGIKLTAGGVVGQGMTVTAIDSTYWVTNGITGTWATATGII